MEIKRIVVGVDFSDENNVAVQEGLRIARRRGADVVLAHMGAVVRDIGWVAPSSANEWARILSEHAIQDKQRLEALRDELMVGDGPELSTLVLDDAPADGLCRAAKQVEADLVVVATHGRTGLKRFLLGSVAERVVRICECDVMVARERLGGGGDYKRILVPTDFSEHSEAALRQALAIASPGATVEVLHFWQLPLILGGGYGESALVSNPDEHQAAVDVEGAKLLEQYNNDRVKVTFHTVQAGATYGIIDWLTTGSDNYDLVIMGSHGRRGFRRLVLGSVAESTVRHAPCSVMVVHLDR